MSPAAALQLCTVCSVKALNELYLTRTLLSWAWSVLRREKVTYTFQQVLVSSVVTQSYQDEFRTVFISWLGGSSEQVNKALEQNKMIN